MYTVYFDLDGVIVDFIRGIESRFGIRYPYSKSGEELYTVMDRHFEDVFTYLPMLPGGELFLDLYRTNPGRVKFLTAVPKHWSAAMYFAGRDCKISWLRQYLPDLSELNDIVVVGDKATKQFYANESTILVDDHNRTVVEWKSRGGIGVNYPSGGLDKKYQRLLAEDVVHRLTTNYNFK